MTIAGANYLGDHRCRFVIWAPEKNNMTLQIVHPHLKMIEMKRDQRGYFHAVVNDINPGDQYFFMPGKKGFPDPASYFQPLGVHGPSAVVDHAAFQWRDEAWRGLPFQKLILYEIHVGTFTKQGTFAAIIPLLDELASTGVNAIELMPIAQFPGSRNWGYDAVFPYAVQNSYGGPGGLKALIDACHKKRIAVFLDVVYNHLGPEGNYFLEFGPYFTKKYQTPWGDALNFDGEWSDGVREYFSNNALYWFQNYHVDGLRLDAIHTIFDIGAVPFWELTWHKIKALEQKLGKHFYMTAESDLNSPRVVQFPEAGGFGFTAMWLDDFHHALYVLLDENGKKLYGDFGSLEQMAKAYTDGFVHSGEFVDFRKRRYGASSVSLPGERFISFNQNHDQVGNRVKGERLSMLVSLEKQMIAAAALLLSPYIPMLFMGEEYGDDTPFYYFVSHSDKELIAAVREGRKKEFEKFQWTTEPPDPQDEKTFLNSKLQWKKRKTGHHQSLLQWHKALITLRQRHPALQSFNKNNVRVNIIEEKGLALYRKSDDGNHQLACLFNFSSTEINYTFPPGSWEKILDSKDNKWHDKKIESNNSSPLFSKGNEKIKLLPFSISIYQTKQINNFHSRGSKK